MRYIKYLKSKNQAELEALVKAQAPGQMISRLDVEEKLIVTNLLYIFYYGFCSRFQLDEMFETSRKLFDIPQYFYTKYLSDTQMRNLYKQIFVLPSEIDKRDVDPVFLSDDEERMNKLIEFFDDLEYESSSDDEDNQVNGNVANNPVV